MNGCDFDSNEKICPPDPKEMVIGRLSAIKQSRCAETLAIHFIIALVLSIILDGGVLLNAFSIATTAYWAAVCVYFVRKSLFPAKQLASLRIAWVPVIAAGMIAVIFMRRIL